MTDRRAAGPPTCAAGAGSRRCSAQRRRADDRHPTIPRSASGAGRQRHRPDNTAVGISPAQPEHGVVAAATPRSVERDVRAPTAGCWNTAVGDGADWATNMTGATNVAVGRFALAQHHLGDVNTAVGNDRRVQCQPAIGNIAIGEPARRSTSPPEATTSTSATLGTGSPTASAIKIGTAGIQTSAFMAGVSGAARRSPVQRCSSTPTGQLGTVMSSRRFKQDIQDMGDASAAAAPGCAR